MTLKLDIIKNKAAQVAGAITLLLLYQIEILKDLSPVIVWEKSRRIGAGYALALKAVLVAARKKESGGMNVYYLSYNKDMTKQFIRDCAYWAKKIGLAAGEFSEQVLRDEKRDLTIYQITMASGFIIQALPSEPRNIRSKQGLVILDEFSFVDEPEELLKAAMALLMWGGQVIILSTHNGVDNFFNVLIEDIKKGRFDYKHYKTDFDEALAQGLYKAICRESGKGWTPEGQSAFRADIIKQYGDDADEELFCIPRKSGGAYIPISLIDLAMERGKTDSVVRLKSPDKNFVDQPREHLKAWAQTQFMSFIRSLLIILNKNLRHYFGFDFGRSGDLSVLWVLAEQMNLDLDTVLVVEIHDLPFIVQEELLKLIVSNLPRFSGGALDAGGNGAALAEYARQTWGPGLIKEIKFSESFYSAEFPPLKASFEDKKLIAPPDSFIRDDLRQVKLIGGVPRIDERRTKGPDGQKRHGDSAIALLLAHYARRVCESVEYWEPVLPQPSPTAALLTNFNR